MFLLFFLMVAAGMLSLLWLYFPLQGSPPPETTPFQAPATVPAALPSGALPQPPEALVAVGAAYSALIPRDRISVAQRWNSVFR